MRVRIKDLRQRKETLLLRKAITCSPDSNSDGQPNNETLETPGTQKLASDSDSGISCQLFPDTNVQKKQEIAPKRKGKMLNFNSLNSVCVIE